MNVRVSDVVFNLNSAGGGVAAFTISNRLRLYAHF